MSNLDFDHDLESDSLSSGSADRRKRQRKRRAQLTAVPKTSFPCGLVAQYMLVASVVALATFLFDWLQPLELVVVTATMVGVMALGYFVLHQRFSGLGSSGGALLLGPVSCGLTVAIAGLLLWSLHQFAPTHAFTDREVASVESKLDALRSAQDHRLTKALLTEAIESSDSEYWRTRWENQLADVGEEESAKRTAEKSADESTSPSVVAATGPFGGHGLPENSPNTPGPAETETDANDSSGDGLNPDPPEDSRVPDGKADSSKISRPAGDSKSDELGSDNVLNRVIEFQRSKKFSAAETYLRRLIQEVPRSVWQCDYEQLYVDHWVDWGNAHTDLDQRHVCYMKALRAARGFRRDPSVLSAMLVRLERELQSQPRLLPAGCQLRVHSVESVNQELVTELSVLSPRGEYLHDLDARDFRIRCGKSDVAELKLTTGDSRPQPLRRNVVVLLDLSATDPIVSEARIDAAKRFFGRLPADTSRLLVALADHTEVSGWATDQRLDTTLSTSMPRSSSPPPLREAVAQAIGQLADRSGSKDLIILSHGQEHPEPYLTTTDLIQRAKRHEVRVHAVIESPAKPSVNRLLADLTQATGGHFQSITPGTSDTAWQTVSRYFPKGNFIVRVALEKDGCRDVRLTVGRGATLLYTALDVPAALQL